MQNTHVELEKVLGSILAMPYNADISALSALTAATGTCRSEEGSLIYTGLLCTRVFEKQEIEMASSFAALSSDDQTLFPVHSIRFRIYFNYDGTREVSLRYHPVQGNCHHWILHLGKPCISRDPNVMFFTQADVRELGLQMAFTFGLLPTQDYVKYMFGNQQNEVRRLH